MIFIENERVKKRINFQKTKKKKNDFRKCILYTYFHYLSYIFLPLGKHTVYIIYYILLSMYTYITCCFTLVCTV